MAFTIKDESGRTAIRIAGAGKPAPTLLTGAEQMPVTSGSFSAGPTNRGAGAVATFKVQADTFGVMSDGRRVLLARAGQDIPMARAVSLGLAKDQQAGPDENKVTGANRPATEADQYTEIVTDDSTSTSTSSDDSEAAEGGAEAASEPEGNMSLEDANAAVDATPEARDLANQNGVKLSTLKGSGSNGQVLVGDVRAALSS